jgi:hypothetical protein
MLASRIGVDISQLWYVFRRPCSTPARPLAQAAERPVPASVATLTTQDQKQ